MLFPMKPMSETNKIKQFLTDYGYTYRHHQRLSGGDCNTVFLVHTATVQLVLKQNDATTFFDFFEKKPWD